MPSQNCKISSENNEFGGNISGYVDDKFGICSRNFTILAGKRVFGQYFAVRLEMGSKKKLQPQTLRIFQMNYRGAK